MLGTAPISRLNSTSVRAPRIQSLLIFWYCSLLLALFVLSSIRALCGCLVGLMRK